jgi:hypothetical protein
LAQRKIQKKATLANETHQERQYIEPIMPFIKMNASAVGSATNSAAFFLASTHQS